MKLGRHTPYSLLLISVQPDIFKCLLFPFFVAFCDSVYRLSYISHLPLFHRVFVAFLCIPLHTPPPHSSDLPLLGFSGKLQCLFNADRFCVQVPHPNAPCMLFSPSSLLCPVNLPLPTCLLGFSGKVSGLQLFFADQVLCAGPQVLPSMPWGGASISSDVTVTRQLVSRCSFSFSLFTHRVMCAAVSLQHVGRYG